MALERPWATVFQVCIDTFPGRSRGACSYIGHVLYLDCWDIVTNPASENSGRLFEKLLICSPLVVKVKILKIFETAQALSFRTPRALKCLECFCGETVRPQVSICFVSKTFEV